MQKTKNTLDRSAIEWAPSVDLAYGDSLSQRKVSSEDVEPVIPFVPLEEPAGHTLQRAHFVIQLATLPASLKASVTVTMTGTVTSAATVTVTVTATSHPVTVTITVTVTVTVTMTVNVSLYTQHIHC